MLTSVSITDTWLKFLEEISPQLQPWSRDTRKPRLLPLLLLVLVSSQSPISPNCFGSHWFPPPPPSAGSRKAPAGTLGWVSPYKLSYGGQDVNSHRYTHESHNRCRMSAAPVGGSAERRGTLALRYNEKSRLVQGPGGIGGNAEAIRRL